MRKEVIIALLSSMVDDAIEKYKDSNPILRGPRGLRGRQGESGEFNFSDHEEAINSLILEAVDKAKDSLKLKFSDLSDSEVSRLVGPRGKDGKSVKISDIEIIVKDHIDSISENLKLKLSPCLVKALVLFLVVE